MQKSNQMVLLKNLLQASSSINYIRFEKDTKKRKRAIGNIVGLGVLFLFLIAYCIIMAIGYGSMGMASALPITAAVTISLIEFIFTLLRVNGSLFAFRDYDTLMSLPFSVKTVVGSKFLYMYVKHIPWFASISLSMLVGYGIFEKPSVLVYITWILLTPFIPIIPMVLAALVGTIIAAIGSGSRHKNVMQTILTFAFVLFAISSRFWIEKIIRDDGGKSALQSMYGGMNSISSIYLPISWFENGVLNLSVSDILLMVGISILVYELFFSIVSMFFKRINSRLMAGAARKKYKMQTLKKNSVVNAIAFKEFRRLVTSTVYLTNVGLGEIFVFIIAIAALIFDADTIFQMVLQGAPVDIGIIIPLIPLIIYFLIGMVPTTACSYSLEGKNFWIPQSLPIKMSTLYKGKILFNLYLTVPFTILGNVCLGISCSANFFQILAFCVTGTALCVFSTVFGMKCDIKHGRMDWDNEVEVIKQGSNVTFYLLPNMFGTMILMAGVIVGAIFGINTYCLLAIITVLAAGLSALIWGTSDLSKQ